MLFQPIKPMLATMRRESFDDDNFIFEPKWDGFRILLHKQGSRIEAFTRNGHNITNKFPELRQVAASIKVNTAIIDCEGVCIRDGRSVFDDFQYRGRLSSAAKIATAVKSHPATFVAFDVLMTDREHMDEPLVDRKARLQEIVVPSGVLVPTMHVEGVGKMFHQLTIERNWEGIVAKRKDSRYERGVYSEKWIKVKNWKSLDTVILGYRRKPQFGLLVGVHFPTVSNKPVAIVELGLKPEQKAAFLGVVPAIHTVAKGEIQYVEPRLCCRIEYLERTERHNLRIAVFKEFLLGKDPAECLWVVKTPPGYEMGLSSVN